MGFENRKTTRVKTGLHLYYWAEGRTDGPGEWGQAVNLSETGLAFKSPRFVAPGELLLLEFSLPGADKLLRLFAKVVHCERQEGEGNFQQLRVQFVNLSDDELLALRQFVIRAADPRLAFGKAHFHGRLPFEASYRDLPAPEQQSLLSERSFLSLKELGYLKNFQAYLERMLGSRVPESFKLLGGKPFRDQSGIWVGLNLEDGQLQVLGKVLWAGGEQDGQSEAGVGIAAFEKGRAIKLEKGA